MSSDKKIKCLVVDDEPLARSVIKNHISKIDFLHFQGEFKNALEANSYLLNNQIDLIFLDINMPHLSGVDFVRQLTPKPSIIFTTAYSEFAVDGFELDALDYLVKPIAFERFFKSANKALKWFSQNYISDAKTDSTTSSPAFVYLKAEDKMIRIELQNIIAIESQGHYVKIYTSTDDYLIHQSITEMEARLPKKNFLRTHRSFIVALHHITAYSAAFIETPKVKVPIGRSYKAEVTEILQK